jgi:hypothetical protein
MTDASTSFQNPPLLPVSDFHSLSSPVAEALKIDPSGELKAMSDQFGLSVEVACGMLANIIDESVRETHGGEFITTDGSKLPW